MCWYWICTVQCSVDWTHSLEETSYFSFLKSFKFFCLQWHVYRVTVYWNIYYELNIRQRSATYIWIIFLEKTVKFMVWVIKFTNLLDYTVTNLCCNDFITGGLSLVIFFSLFSLYLFIDRFIGRHVHICIHVLLSAF